MEVKTLNREDMQTRSISGAFKTRSEDGGELYIEGYFSVFDSNYDLWLERLRA